MLGTNLSNKFKKNLQSIIKKIEIDIIKYNELRNLLPLLLDNYPEASLEQIIKNTSKFWKFTVSSGIQIKDVPHDKIFDIIIEYHNLNRANEEIKMIPTEMKRAIKYWKRIESNIVNLIEDLKQRKNLSINEVFNHHFFFPIIKSNFSIYIHNLAWIIAIFK